MIKNKKIYKKMLVIGILIIFLGAAITPTISGDNYDNQESINLTFYTFNKTGTKKCKTELSREVAEEISDMFEELKIKITNDPKSDKTQLMKNEFIETLDTHGIIPQKISKDYITKLLNPKWLRYDGKIILPEPFSSSASAFLCSIAGGGRGIIFSPVMLPRPRLASIWSSYIDAQSIAANLYTGHGFVASGSQVGIAIGFMGIGLSFAFPGEPATFGFGGYALAAYVKADDIDTYPANQVPIISEENPSDGSQNVPNGLSELSFRISDNDGDRMSYAVTTEPDIGGGEGSGFDGVYTVPITGLEYDKSYSWTISVSDGEDSIEKKLRFITKSSPPFNPFDEGWSYRKKVTINHSLIDEGLNNFPVLVSLVDSDLAEKAQFDGDDILFMEDTGVANKLYHEIEKYDGSSGEIITWINVNRIHSDKDTTFYIYYGNPNCNSQQIPKKAWDLHYKAVYHMNYNNGGLIDSTLNNIDCNNILGYPEYQKMGKIGNAIDFEKSNEDAFEGFDIFDGQEELTVEAWINLEEYHPSHCMIASHEDAWYFYISYQYKSVIFGLHGGVSGSCAIDDINCPLDTWYCVVGSWSDSYDRMRVYGNGVLKDTYIETLPMYTSPYNFAVGYQDNMGKFFDGVIDELRLSDIERSEDWIKTTYINQNDPSSFLTFGQEETN